MAYLSNKGMRRDMYFERFKEAVLSEEALRAAEGQLPQPQPGAVLPDMGLCLQAALSKAQELMEEGG